MFLFFGCCFLLVSCKNDEDQSVKRDAKQLKPALELSLKSNEKGVKLAQKIERQAGGEVHQTATIKADYQGDQYVVSRNCGRFKIKRISTNAAQQTVTLTLSNVQLQKTVDGNVIKLTDSVQNQLVDQLLKHVFLLEFPFGINSQTVRKQYLKNETINGEKYAKLEVAFLRSRVKPAVIANYIIWINPETATVAFVANTSNSDKTEMEFRKAINPRLVNGIRVVDYEYYHLKTPNSATLSKLGFAFQQGKLKKIRQEEWHNLKVEISDRHCD